MKNEQVVIPASLKRLRAFKILFLLAPFPILARISSFPDSTPNAASEQPALFSRVTISLFNVFACVWHLHLIVKFLLIISSHISLVCSLLTVNVSSQNSIYSTLELFKLFSISSTNS
jgi:hypothetical protein